MQVECPKENLKRLLALFLGEQERLQGLVMPGFRERYIHHGHDVNSLVLFPVMVPEVAPMVRSAMMPAPKPEV